MTLLSAVFPRWHFREIHHTTIAASAERVWAAIRQVTPREIRLFLLLMGLRSLPARVTGQAPNRAGLESQPLLATALGSGFLLLAEEPERGLAPSWWTLEPLRARSPRCRDHVRPTRLNIASGWSAPSLLNPDR